MEAAEYKNIYENESFHFFYVSNHALFLWFVSDFRKKIGKRLRILDAGCGTGLLARKLKGFGGVVCVDISPQALFYSKKRGLNVKKASIENLPFRRNSFDLVVSMDVIYHKEIRSDKKALAEIFRVLKPRGMLLLRVPANPFLLSSHDRFVHTRQRYKKDELQRKLESVGFEIKKITYVNSVLFFPALVKAIFQKIKKSHDTRSEIKPIPDFINQTIIILLGIENLLIKHVSLPFGIGLFAVAKKPKMSYNQKK